MLSHLRRRIGVITAIAVLAALVPAFSTSPASAAPAVSLIFVVTDAPAGYKACPTSADIPASGFTDTTDAAVDCLAYYGITKGTTATTYEPTASVARWAMALYLTRAASKAGVTLGTGADQGFTDISGKSAEIQTAINQIKQLGITTGKTATTFAPDDNVSRQEMAMFLERMLDNTAPGPGGVTEAELVGGGATTYVNSDCGTAAGCTGKYNYTDIDSGSVTVEASIAIKELFTLGIHDGITATTFSPDADMTRAAMATFMNAALDHTNVRPAGLTIQASAYANNGAFLPTLSVSYRDASHVPITGTAVDVFRWTPTNLEGDRAFATATGLCEDAVLTTGSVTGCKIDVGEPVTDLNGNLTPTANTSAVYSQAYGIAGVDNYYAWTGALATLFDNDLHSSGSTYDAIAVVTNLANVATSCSHDAPAYAAATSAHIVQMAFAAVTTYTCQVASVDADTFFPVPAALVPVTFNRTRVNTNLATVGSSATSQAENVVCFTDATGSCSFTVTGPAVPAAPVVTDIVIDTVVITTANATDGVLPATGYSGFMTDGGTTLTSALKYMGAAAVGGRTALTQTASSHLASYGGAVGGVVRTVTATSYNSFGSPMAAHVITFDSVDALVQGTLCTNADPAVCTTASLHSLTTGDVIQVVTKGNFVGVCSAEATAAGKTGDTSAFEIIATNLTTAIFSAKCSDGDNLAGTTAGVAATPMEFATRSFATVDRTTNSAGQASHSWTDIQDHSALDLVTASPAAGTAASVKYFRLAAAADVSEVGNGDATPENSEVNVACVAIDATAQWYILQKVVDLVATHQTISYLKFSWDDNDQYRSGGIAANLQGTAGITEATWLAAMKVLCAAGNAAATGFGGAVTGVVVHVDYVAGLSTDIQMHSLD